MVLLCTSDFAPAAIQLVNPGSCKPPFKDQLRQRRFQPSRDFQHGSFPPGSPCIASSVPLRGRRAYLATTWKQIVFSLSLFMVLTCHRWVPPISRHLPKRRRLGLPADFHCSDVPSERSTSAS